MRYALSIDQPDARDGPPSGESLAPIVGAAQRELRESGAHVFSTGTHGADSAAAFQLSGGKPSPSTVRAWAGTNISTGSP